MNPATLRETIVIWEKGDEKQPSGYTKRDSRPVCTLKASRADASTREIWEAMAAKTRGIVNWTARWVDGLRPGMWVVWKDQWHEIIAVQGPIGMPRRMVLKTVLKDAK